MDVKDTQDLMIFKRRLNDIIESLAPGQEGKQGKGDEEENDPDHVGCSQRNDPIELPDKHKQAEQPCTQHGPALNGRQAVGQQGEMGEKKGGGRPLNHRIPVAPEGLYAGKGPVDKEHDLQESHLLPGAQVKGISADDGKNDEVGKDQECPLKALTHAVFEGKPVIDVKEVLFLIRHGSAFLSIGQHTGFSDQVKHGFYPHAQKTKGLPVGLHMGLTNIEI